MMFITFEGQISYSLKRSDKIQYPEGLLVGAFFYKGWITGKRYLSFEKLISQDKGLRRIYG
jgi:hypothetical protein